MDKVDINEIAEGCILLNYFTDGNTAYVKVGIIINGMEHIDYLPVMDFRNNSIRMDKVTSMDINKAIQRSTAKAIAMHGLGLALWTNEDIPTHVPETTPSTDPTPAPELTEITTKSKEWEQVTKYVADNYKNGIEKIGKQLNRRYKMSAATKKLIAAIITNANKLEEELSLKTDPENKEA